MITPEQQLFIEDLRQIVTCPQVIDMALKGYLEETYVSLETLATGFWCIIEAYAPMTQRQELKSRVESVFAPPDDDLFLEIDTERKRQKVSQISGNDYFGSD